MDGNYKKQSNPQKIKVTMPGKQYFEEDMRELGFFTFIHNLAFNIDQKVKIAAETLFSLEESEEEKARYKKTIDDGGMGASKQLLEYSQFTLELFLCRATDNFLSYFSARQE